MGFYAKEQYFPASNLVARLKIVLYNGNLRYGFGGTPFGKVLYSILRKVLRVRVYSRNAYFVINSTLIYRKVWKEHHPAVAVLHRFAPLPSPMWGFAL